jgi:hypothetical protein
MVAVLLEHPQHHQVDTLHHQHLLFHQIIHNQNFVNYNMVTDNDSYMKCTVADIHSKALLLHLK